ncbi:TPM domain-containing protein [Actinotalea solisilvae]|uniref:TPM domain-containing protein n=1 Tax=Actinotalea solisilvae TaxID=2072922 RepID=UPI0018F192CD|nr:TPM domain-containing protein [Actinotalea solisilvae]
MLRPRRTSAPVTVPVRWAAALHRATCALAAVGVLLAGPLLGAPASAEEPQALRGELTDLAGVLSEGEERVVQGALDRLADATEYQLFVVYVDTFDDLGSFAWADETAALSDLGRDDLLLAVAVEDRQYRVSAHDDVALTSDLLRRVETTDIEPALRDDDWAGAAVAAADGYRAAATGPGVAPVLAVLAVPVVAGGVVWVAHRRRTARRAGAADLPAAALTAEELERRAGVALVSVDEAVRASEQELGFAQAQFGDEATRTFADVLAQATATLTAAFGLRASLDDGVRETPEQRRAALTEVLRLCDEVDDALDAQTEAFARLRDLHARAPQWLDELDARAQDGERRLPAARSTYDALAAVHPAAALVSVRDNVDGAAALIAHAHEVVTRARGVLDTDRPAAVDLARTAEDGVARAFALLDALHGARSALAEAPARIDAAVASLAADIADADRLGTQDAGVVGASVAARQVVAAVPEQRAAGDPLALLQRLAEAEAALDSALMPLREHEAAQARARQRLAQVLQRVDGTLLAIGRSIQVRGSDVGSNARMLYGEAQAHVARANGLSETDAVAALAAADRAEYEAGRARRAVETDLERAQRSTESWSARTSGFRWDSDDDESSRGGGWGGSGGSSGGGWWSGGSGGSSRSSSSRSSSRSRRASGGSFGRSSSSRRSSSGSSRRSSSSRSSSSRRSKGGGGRF